MRIGSLDPALGGLSQLSIHELMTSGEVLIPHMSLCPSYICMNSDYPAEIEVKFEFEKFHEDMDPEQLTSKCMNWQLQFVYNQLLEKIQNPGRFCPGPFHMTYLRKGTFRSTGHMMEYLQRCSGIVAKWRQDWNDEVVPVAQMYISPTTTTTNTTNTTTTITSTHTSDCDYDSCKSQSQPHDYNTNLHKTEVEHPHGLYLFKHRQHILQYYPPNFHPPYNTPDKAQIIKHILSKSISKSH